MTVRYDDVLGPLREAYDARAGWRDGLAKEPWKLAEREVFRRRLAPGARLLEVGAGTGQDSAYFMDFLHLNFPLASFDAVFAMNCLLHVPNDDLPAVLAAVRAVLHPVRCRGLPHCRHRPRPPPPIADCAAYGWQIATLDRLRLRGSFCVRAGGDERNLSGHRGVWRVGGWPLLEFQAGVDTAPAR